MSQHNDINDNVTSDDDTTDNLSISDIIYEEENKATKIVNFLMDMDVVEPEDIESSDKRDWDKFIPTAWYFIPSKFYEKFKGKYLFLKFKNQYFVGIQEEVEEGEVFTIEILMNRLKRQREL